MNTHIILFSLLFISLPLVGSQVPRQPTVQGTIGYYLNDMNHLLSLQKIPDTELLKKFMQTQEIIEQLRTYMQEQMPHPYHQSDTIPETIVAAVKGKAHEIPSVYLCGIWTDQYKKWIEEALDRKFLFDRDKLLEERKCTESKQKSWQK